MQKPIFVNYSKTTCIRCMDKIQAIFLNISFPSIPESCNHHRYDFVIFWEPLFNCPFLWVHFQLLGALLVFFLPMSFAPFELCLHFNHCPKSQLSWAFFRNYGWLFHRLQCSAVDDQLLHCIRVSPKLVMHFFRVLLTLSGDWEVIGWSSSCWWICVLAQQFWWICLPVGHKTVTNLQGTTNVSNMF
jgi:hypothetical protein